jgi:hypothetical protein
MARAHDVGGVSGFGRIEREIDEPPFHHEWEARVFALNRLLLGARVYNLDEFRYAVERLCDSGQANAPYYARWLEAIELLLREKGVVE